MNGDDSMKKICVILMIIMISIMSLNVVMAGDFRPTPPEYSEGSVPQDMKTKVQQIWATVSVIVQTLAVGCVVFAGLRYMFAAPSEKADIKQGLIYLTIGAVLVFSAITIIRFVTNAANQVLG